MSYLERLRATPKFFGYATPPTDKTDETPELGSSVSFVSTPPGISEKIEAPEARKLWLIRHTDGSLFEHSFTPPATLAEVLEFYPGALVEPILSAKEQADIAEAVEERAAIRDTEERPPVLAPGAYDLPGTMAREARALTAAELAAVNAYLDREGEGNRDGIRHVHRHPRAVNAYLDREGEGNPATRALFADICARDPAVMADVLARTERPPPLSATEQADIAEAIAERAAIREYDGGAPREEAEREAHLEVACARCAHWTPNRINPRGGLGSCLVNAPASRRPGSLWPTGEIRCREWEAMPCR